MTVKEAREAKGMTQQELADKINVTRQHISEIERGKIHPSVPLAKTIGEVLDVEWTNFFED